MTNSKWKDKNTPNFNLIIANIKDHIILIMGSISKFFSVIFLFQLKSPLRNNQQKMGGGVTLNLEAQ